VSDYEGYPSWPSAQNAVLEYFEGEAHRELDMTRDECPGTAAALKEACEEHIGSALALYDSYNAEKKQRLHDEKLKELKDELEHVKMDVKCAEKEWREAKEAWKAFQKNPPKRKRAPKTRADEIRLAMEPMEMELAMEDFAGEVDRLRKHKTRLVRDLKRENLFVI